MISISVDEAFAYDLLAILMIKGEKCQNRSPEVNNARWRLEGELEHQGEDDESARAGILQHSQVLRSPQFAALRQANLTVFNRIDAIKARGEQPGDATFVDQHNYQRFLCKRDLQERFFPASPLTEQKLGYDQPEISLDTATNPNTISST